MSLESNIRKDILEVGKRLNERFFIASNDGNISARVDKNSILITPTGINKGYLKEEQLIKCDLEGNKLSGDLEVTSEIKMHLVVYKNREDVNAIVHAHPPASTAFASTTLKLDEDVILPEAIFSLGKIGYCSYGTPSTSEVSISVEKEVMDSNVLLLSNHGALTLGKDVLSAYYKMENLEMVSRITMYTKILGNTKKLNEEQVDKLTKIKLEKGW